MKRIDRKEIRIIDMVEGNIYSNGISSLINLNGSENELYMLKYFFIIKNNFYQLKNKNYFSNRLGAILQSSELNKRLIYYLFGEEKLLQNPHSSPDLSY